jgi:hypothetical protein
MQRIRAAATGGSMRRRVIAATPRLRALVAWWLLALPAVAADYRAGVAVRDVTPDQASLDAGQTYLGGYGLWKNRGAAQSVHDPLSARAFCIADAVGPLCLVVVDSLGLSGPTVQRIARAAAVSGRIEAERVLVAATHTHAAPDVLGLWGGAPPEYGEFLIVQTAAAVGDAMAALRPADLRYAMGRAPAYNRRGWGYTDDALVVIQAHAADGTLIGSLINFAAHPVVSDAGNRAISSDFVHSLRDSFEAASGAPVMFVNGALGDATPGPRAESAPDPGDAAYWAPVERYGVALADAAVAAVAAAAPVGPGIVLRRETVDLPVANWTLSLAQRLGVLDDHMSGPPWRRRVSTSVAVLSLGTEVQAVTLPGEALTRLGLDFKARLTAPARLVLGQTGGSLGYFVPEDEWRTGRNRDYEESVSLGRDAARSLGAAIARMAGTAPGEPGPTTTEGD